MFSELRQYIDSFLPMGIPGADCIIYKDGEEIFRHITGVRDPETDVPMDGTERYNLYSCSKPITCAAALQLYEQGKFTLDDPISEYFPAFTHMKVRTANGLREASVPIRIRDLFMMVAGLSYDTASPSILQAKEDTGGCCPTVVMMDYLAAEPLLFEPGTRFHYSLCHDVLAALVEKLSGISFPSYVKTHIFDPLGMTQSTFLLPPEELDTITEQFCYDAAAGKLVKCGKNVQYYKFGTEYASGGAGCISTVTDYIRFLEAMRQGDVILGSDTIDQMRRNRLTEAQRSSYTMVPGPGYGYGLGVRCGLPGSRITEFGWGGAAGAYLSVDRTNGLTVFYAQHVLSAPNQSIRAQVRTYALRALGKG